MLESIFCRHNEPAIEYTTSRESGDQATVGQLETLLKDPDTGVQKAARLALEKLKQPSSKN